MPTRRDEKATMKAKKGAIVYSYKEFEWVGGSEIACTAREHQA